MIGADPLSVIRVLASAGVLSGGTVLGTFAWQVTTGTDTSPTGAQQARAEQEPRNEMERAVADYCDAHDQCQGPQGPPGETVIAAAVPPRPSREVPPADK